MSLYVTGNSINEVYLKLDNCFSINCNRSVSSRAGDTKEILHTMLTISNSCDRWTTVRVPAISPAYAFAELIYVMSGSNRSDIINPWNPALPKYQGDYLLYPGAYGFRLRHAFGFDQLEKTYEALLYNPQSRQVLMDIWSPEIDFPQEEGRPTGQDIPCNTMSMLKIRDKKLYWTQVMRSNDLYLGLPYDVLLFTSLQEVIAGWLNVEAGEYTHYCDSLHYYTDRKMAVEKSKSITWRPSELRLEKHQSDEVFKELFKRMEELSTGRCVEDTVSSILSKQTFPGAYEDMLLIMCLYMLSRKDGNDDLISRCYEKCNNNNYKIMFTEWGKRRQKN